jgi:hypothetical protein
MLFAASLFTAGSSSASPTTPNAVWSWGGLYVTTYYALSSGDLGAIFENSVGTEFTAWNDQNGVNQCPGQSMLHLASAYAPAPEIGKLLLAAAIEHKPVKVWFEATSGICYIKQMSITP